MNKHLNYFLSLFAFAAILFLASCGDNGEIPLPGDNSITLSTADGAIDDGVLLAPPGATVGVAASLGIGSTGQITVVTDNSSVVSVPSNNTISSGDTIRLTVPANAQLGDSATVTFSSGNISEQLLVKVGYNTVLQAATANPNLSILAQAVEAAGLETTLSGTGPFTVFAPTNAAFEALAAQMGVTTEQLLASEDLENILLYHVVAGETLANAFTDGQTLETQADGNASVVITKQANGNILVNGATVTTADVQTGNGVVHVINRVLVPQTVAVYTAVLLAAPTKDAATNARTSKTFFSADDGMTYSVDQVVAGTDVTSADIDFGYYYGQQDAASLASPSVYPTNVYDLGSTGANWSARNQTLFLPVNNFTTADFDAISEGQAYRLEQEYEIATGTPTAQITQLTEGSIYTFKTADNRYGILRVDEILPGIESNKSITIAVKVTS